MFNCQEQSFVHHQYFRNNAAFMMRWNKDEPLSMMDTILYDMHRNIFNIINQKQRADYLTKYKESTLQCWKCTCKQEHLRQRQRHKQSRLSRPLLHDHYDNYVLKMKHI